MLHFQEIALYFLRYVGISVATLIALGWFYKGTANFLRKDAIGWLFMLLSLAGGAVGVWIGGTYASQCLIIGGLFFGLGFMIALPKRATEILLDPTITAAYPLAALALGIFGYKVLYQPFKTVFQNVHFGAENWLALGLSVVLLLVALGVKGVPALNVRRRENIENVTHEDENVTA